MRSNTSSMWQTSGRCMKQPVRIALPLFTVLLDPTCLVDRPVGKPRKRIHRDQGAANSPLPTLLPAIRQLSPSSENAGPSSTPLPSRNRNYPYWLLNETPAHIASPSLTGSSESSTVALLNDQDQSPLTGPSSAQDGFDNDNNQPS